MPPCGRSATCWHGTRPHQLQGCAKIHIVKTEFGINRHTVLADVRQPVHTHDNPNAMSSCLLRPPLNNCQIMSIFRGVLPPPVIIETNCDDRTHKPRIPPPPREARSIPQSCNPSQELETIARRSTSFAPPSSIRPNQGKGTITVHVSG